MVKERDRSGDLVKTGQRRLVMSRRAAISLSLAARIYLTSGLFTSLLFLVCAYTDMARAQAPLPPITSSGLNTQVSAPIPINGKTQYDITGGTRFGTNLFHSFGQFNVPTNNIANFLNDTPHLATSNILGRVTGPNPSSIFGTIKTTDFGNANLFLMNPAGIIFGPNTSLSVGGSVTFTTANYLRLAEAGGTNAGIFHADPNLTSVLTSAPVIAFGFLSSNPATISVQGSNLSVPTGQSLSLVGGNQGFMYADPDTGNLVSVPNGFPVAGARLSAPNGQIQLASAASPGEFLLSNLQPAPNINGVSFSSFGTVNLAPGSTIDVSGTETVSIRGGQFVLSMNDSVLNTSASEPATHMVSLSTGSSIISSNSASEPGSDIQITAANIQMDGASVTSQTIGSGPGGNISVTRQNINLANGAQIVSSTTGAGDGGNISISATETLSLSGFDTTGTLPGLSTGYVFSPDTGLPLVTSGVFTTTSAMGNCPGCSKGGAIQITAPTITLDNAGAVATITSGDGRGGDITLNGGILNLTGAAQLWSSAGQDPVTFEFRGSGNGGDIKVTAANSVLISGGNPDLFANSIINSTALNTGRGGNIFITAPNVSLQGGATVLSSTFGSGTGGEIAISASNRLSVLGLDEIFGIPSNLSSLAGSSGNGGAITVNAGSVALAGSGRIHTESFDVGNAGDVTLQVQGNLSITGLGVIDSAASSSSSGNISVSADTVTIAGHVGGPLLGQGPFQASQIVNAGGSATGDIDINARQLLLTDGARINSDAGFGAPGAIRIAATESVTVSDGAKVRMDTSSASSGGGLMDITAPAITLDQGILQTLTVGRTDAASINLQADNLTLSGGFIDSSTRSGSGARGGDVTIAVTDKFVTTGQFTGSGTDSPRPAGISTFTGSLGGNAGSISISAGAVDVSAGARINSSSDSPGGGGAMTITAGNFISLQGSGTGLLSEANKAGPGGTIILQAPQVQITDGAVVSAKSTGSGAAGSVTIEGPASPAESILIDGSGSGVFTATSGTGAGGDMFLHANSVTLQNGGTLSATSTGTAATAVGGTIGITATDSVSLTGGASIAASSSGPAHAGNIAIDAGHSFFMQDSSVTTSATQASGGDISVQASSLFRMINSRMTASVQQGSNTFGGNITIDPEFVILQNQSQILATAVEGTGGNILIVTPVFLRDQTSIVDASSQFGRSGTVTIQSPTSQLAGTLATLPQSVRQAAALTTVRCAAQMGGQASSFVVAGRDTLPTEPGGWLMSALATASAGAGERGLSGLSAPDRPGTPSHQTDPREQTDPTPVLPLRRMTPTGFLTQAFAIEGAAGCGS
jgi:filamentous hemagglutinin family protein